MLSGQSLQDVLGTVARLAKRCIPRAHDVSITLLDGDRPTTTAVTGPLAAAVDEAQYERGYGPCLDAALNSGALLVVDMTAEPRWPDYAPVAAKKGVLSSLSVHLPIEQHLVGALNVYATEPYAFDDEDVRLAEQFASYAAVAIGNAHAYAGAAALAAQMQEAMRSRAVIEQAKGILMLRNKCSADEAFGLLTLMSQHRNRKLRDIAAELVASARTSGL